MFGDFYIFIVWDFSFISKKIPLKHHLFKRFKKSQKQ